MTLLLAAATIPYLCRTHCPTQAGRGQPKRPQAPPHRGGGDKACDDDITTNKRQQPYHTSVEHTNPHRRGGANQKDHRPTPQGGRGRGQTRPDGESNKAKRDNYPLDRQGGIPWGGGGRGGVAALHHICIYVYMYVYIYIYYIILYYIILYYTIYVLLPSAAVGEGWKIYMCIHTYAYTNTRKHIGIPMQTCIHTYLYIQTHTHRDTHTHIHTNLHVHIHACTHTYIHTYIHAYIGYIHIHF